MNLFAKDAIRTIKRKLAIATRGTIIFKLAGHLAVKYLSSLCNMFSNHERQKERTGRSGTPRDEYLQDLVTEFQTTTSEESKEQIVANLGNFAYDPLNYEYLRKLHVLDLFLDCLTEPNEKLVEFGAGGICNCSPDPANAAVLVANKAVPLLISCLSSPVENTVLSTMASLYYLCVPATRKDILIPPVLDCFRAYAAPGSVNPRFQNLAKAFLEKYIDNCKAPVPSLCQAFLDGGRVAGALEHFLVSDLPDLK